MIEFYNAFISYKHAELDSKIAEDIHRSLERFHVPKSIRKKTGFKKIERVFRDKNELPITSDLSDTISNALEKSEYLIVICSPNTKESMWVPREIEYFLRNHSKKQILTVLAGGESKDVILDELRYDERVETDDTGEERTVKTSIEPLACDYRIPIKRARKEELPRLAAALLGCSYDELVGRQRQYRRRRRRVISGIVLTILLAFAGYMTYSRYRINKNYRDAMENRSRYLANESMRLMENDNRVEALQLALASLPSEDDDYSVTPESIKALIKASFAYKTPFAHGFDLVWDYSMQNTIIDFSLTSESDYLAAVDDEANVCVWNTNDHRKCVEINNNGAKGIKIAKDDSLLLWSETTVYNYTIPDGSLRWSYNLKDYKYYRNPILDAYDGTVYIQTKANIFQHIKLDDGSILESITLPDRCNDEDIIDYDFPVLSPDGTRMAVFGSTWQSNGVICVYDFLSGSFTYCIAEGDNILTLEWGNNNSLLVLFYEGYGSSDAMDNMSIVSNNNNCICCYDANSFIKKWSSNIVSRGVGGYSRWGVNIIRMGNNAFVISIADSAYKYDVNSGELILGGSVPGRIVSSEVSDNGNPMFYTNNGELVLFQPDKGTDVFGIVKGLSKDVKKAVCKKGFYVLDNNLSQIYYYRFDVYDDELTRIEDNMSYEYINGKYCCIEEGFMATIDKNANLNLYDVDKCEYLQTIPLSNYNSYSPSFHLLGIYNQKLYITNNKSYDDLECLIVDLNSFSIETKALGYPCSKQSYLAEGKIVYAEKNDLNTNLSVYDTVTGNKVVVPFDFDTEQTEYSMFISPVAGVVYCAVENKCEWLIDINKRTVLNINVSESWNGVTNVCENETGSQMAITDGDEIYVIDTAGNKKLSIDCEGKRPVGMAIERVNEDKYDTLLVAYNNCDLVRYELSTGSTLGVSSYAVGSIDENASFYFDKDKHQVYLLTDSYGIMNIIDTDTWTLHAYFWECLGYTGASDKYIVALDKEETYDYKLYYFNHYTLEDLKRKAKDILQTEEMSDEFKMMYAIK